MAQYGPPSIANTINDFTKSVGGNINTLQGQYKVGGLPRTEAGDVDWQSAAGMAFAVAHPEMFKSLSAAGQTGDERELLRTQIKRAGLIPISEDQQLYDVNRGGPVVGAGPSDNTGVPPEIQQLGARAIREWKVGKARESVQQTTPRDFTFTDTGKLTTQGKNYTEAVNLDQSFKPEYGDASVFGAARNWYGRNAPEWASDPKAREAAAWWQRYDTRKNLVRNDLFGAALSKGEQAAFDAADITPGMSSAMIAANLRTQRAILENAIGREAASLVKSRYPIAPIAAAYGVSPQRMQQLIASSVPEYVPQNVAQPGAVPGAAPPAPAGGGPAQPPKVGTIAVDEKTGKPKWVWDGTKWAPAPAASTAPDTNVSSVGAP